MNNLNSLTLNGVKYDSFNDLGAIKHNILQSLSESEKALARENIGAVSKEFVEEKLSAAGGGSSSGDLLNKNGKIKQEILPNGYPYETDGETLIWEANISDLIKVDEAEDGEGFTLFAISDNFKIYPQKEYTIEGGVDETDKASVKCISQSIDQDTAETLGFVSVGSVMIYTELANLPFIFINLKDPFVINDDSGIPFYSFLVIPTAVVPFFNFIKIIAPFLVTPLDKKYLPQDIPRSGSGLNSLIFGINSDAKGPYSFAGGNFSIANGYQSIAIGEENTVNGDFSTALGTQNLIEVQDLSSLNIGSYSFGHNNKLYGYNQTVIGNSNESHGGNNFIFGVDNNIDPNGYTNNIFGYSNILDDTLDTSTIGSNNVAEKSTNCLIFGQLNKVNDTNYAYMLGKNLHLLANKGGPNDAIIIMGQFNKDADENNIFVIGNGNHLSIEGSNAHTLDYDGTAWYSGDVYVGSTSGTHMDEGSKKLATEEYVDNKITEIVNSVLDALPTWNGGSY